MKHPLGLLLTRACVNNCVICCTEGPVVPKFYAIGKNDLEKKALANLSSNRGVMVSGGDPLRNLDGLEVISEYATDRTVVVNPISLVKMSDIRRERALSVLSRFGIAWSLGDSRGSEHGENEKAWQYVQTLIKDDALLALQMHRLEGTIRKENGQLFLDNAQNILLAGRLRELYDKGELATTVYGPRTLISHECPEMLAQNSEDPKIIFGFFEKKDADEARLVLLPCCSEGLHEYISFPTELTVSRLAQADDVDSLLEAEYAKFSKHTICNYLRFENGVVELSYAAENCIRKRGGTPRELLGNTPSLTSMLHPCSYCNEIGRELQRNGITREEFLQYFERKKPTFKNKMYEIEQQLLREAGLL